VDAVPLIESFIEAYQTGDRATMTSLLARDLVAYVTNADGGADRVEGVDVYLARLPDLPPRSCRCG
jgi:hypothetical protein